MHSHFESKKRNPQSFQQKSLGNPFLQEVSLLISSWSALKWEIKAVYGLEKFRSNSSPESWCLNSPANCNTDFILSVCFPVIFNNQSTGNPSLLVISYLVTGELFYLLYLNFSIFLLPYTTQYNFMHGCSLT